MCLKTIVGEIATRKRGVQSKGDYPCKKASYRSYYQVVFIGGAFIQERLQQE